MRRTTKLVVGMTIVALLAAALPSATQARPKRKPPKVYKAEGFVAGVGVVTHSNFIAQCPELPASQSVDAYVVEVPFDFGAAESQATVEATSVSLDPAVELSFYTYGCDQGELYVPAPTTVPAGTGYIVVQDLSGGNVNFELTLTQR